MSLHHFVQMPTQGGAVKVTGGDPKEQPSDTSNADSPKFLIDPNILSLLNNLIIIGQLAKNSYDQLVSHETAAVSQAKRYEEAYLQECRKLQQASEANIAMGREIEKLRELEREYKAALRHLEDGMALADAEINELAGRNMDLEAAKMALEARILNLENEI